MFSLCREKCSISFFFFFQAEDGIRDATVTGVQTCALPICPWLLLALVFMTTCVFGFLIQAAGSAYLWLRADPIASQYRTTLSYTSAIVGDGILIPLVNVFITSQLVLWRRSPRVPEIAGAMLLGALVTG